MNLKTKLSVNSTLLFAFILGLVLIGSFLLFKSHRKDLYYEKLEIEREKHLKGETESYSWEEVKQRLMKDYDL